LSCDFERKQNAGIQSSPDFVSLMLQNSISEEEGKDPNKERVLTTIHAGLPFYHSQKCSNSSPEQP